jgi:hypothetical protein
MMDIIMAGMVIIAECARTAGSAVDNQLANVPLLQLCNCIPSFFPRVTSPAPVHSHSHPNQHTTLPSIHIREIQTHQYP